MLALSVSLCVHPSVGPTVSVRLAASFRLIVCMPVGVPACHVVLTSVRLALSFCQSVRLPVSVSLVLRPSVSLAVRPSVSLPVSLCAGVPVRLPVSLAVFPLSLLSSFVLFCFSFPPSVWLKETRLKPQKTKRETVSHAVVVPVAQLDI